MIRPTLAAALLASSSMAPLQAAPFTATEMMKLKRLADPQVSPDGKWALYAQTHVDLAANTRNSDLWILPLAGGEPRRITSHPKSASRGRFSPDGRRIAFVSAREGGGQVYVTDLQGADPRKVTSLPTDAGGVSWIDDRTLLVTSDVHPDCADAACNRKKIDEAGKPSSARAYDNLFVRHWDTWEDHRASHLFVVPLD